MTSLILPFEKGIRVSGALILIGLIIEIVTLNWSHPTSILWYLMVGGGFFFLGIVYYLILLVWGDTGD